MTILSDVKQALAGEIETPTNMDHLIGLCQEDLTTDELEVAKKNHPSAFAILEQPVGSITTLPEPTEENDAVVVVDVVTNTAEKPVDATAVVAREDTTKGEPPVVVVVEKKARVSHKASGDTAA